MSNQPHLFYTPCNTVTRIEYRVLVLKVCCGCSTTPYEKPHDVASCTEKRYVHTDTLDRAVDAWMLDTNAITLPHNCDYEMLKPVEQYLGKWYRSSRWRMEGIINRQVPGAFFTSSQQAASFALLRKRSYCDSFEMCQHRKCKVERVQKETRLPAYSK